MCTMDHYRKKIFSEMTRIDNVITDDIKNIQFEKFESENKNYNDFINFVSEEINKFSLQQKIDLVQNNFLQKEEYFRFLIVSDLIQGFIYDASFQDDSKHAINGTKLIESIDLINQNMIKKINKKKIIEKCKEIALSKTFSKNVKWLLIDRTFFYEYRTEIEDIFGLEGIKNKLKQEQ